MQGYKIIERRPGETAEHVIRYEMSKRSAILKAMRMAADAMIARQTRQHIVRRIDGGGGHGGSTGV